MCSSEFYIVDLQDREILLTIKILLTTEILLITEVLHCKITEWPAIFFHFSIPLCKNVD